MKSLNIFDQKGASVCKRRIHIALARQPCCFVDIRFEKLYTTTVFLEGLQGIHERTATHPISKQSIPQTIFEMDG